VPGVLRPEAGESRRSSTHTNRQSRRRSRATPTRVRALPWL
jgi:hypothetical protein